MNPLHADELSVDLDTVRRLVDRAFPRYAELDLAPARATGSSNALFHLGDDRVVRVPRQPGGGASIEKEARWLPFVAARVDVRVPAVLGVGEPDADYGERWAVTDWLDGTTPSSGAGSVGLARDVARFVAQLRAMEIPPGAAEDEALRWYRGLSLDALDADFRGAAAECRDLGVALDPDETLRVWDRAVEASLIADAASAWFHGDLMAENLLLDAAGRLSAVLDFGGLAIGNPTVDLVVAWEVLDEPGRREFRRLLDIDDATWTASRGWALLLALITFPCYGATMPRRCAARLAMAQAALASR